MVRVAKGRKRGARVRSCLSWKVSNSYVVRVVELCEMPEYIRRIYNYPYLQATSHCGVYLNGRDGSKGIGHLLELDSKADLKADMFLVL